MTTTPQFQCAKCGHDQYETDQFRATGSNFAKLFDIQNKKFNTLTCLQCGYTEIYRDGTSRFGNILDFFVGG